MTASKQRLIVYAQSEGSQLLGRWGTEAEYEQMKADGYVPVPTMLGTMLVEVSYVALTKIERDFDATLNGPREASKS